MSTHRYVLEIDGEIKFDDEVDFRFSEKRMKQLKKRGLYSNKEWVLYTFRKSRANSQINSRVSSEQMIEIKKSYELGLMPMTELAAKYHTSRSVIKEVLLEQGVTIDPYKFRLGVPKKNFMNRFCNSKLTPQDIPEIRRLYALGNTSTRKLAKQYGVGATAIKKIVNGTTYTKW